MANPNTTKSGRAKLTKTGTPGIFRRHAKDCDGKGRCDCAYVVVWRHRGRQHTETHPTYVLAREAQGDRARGERRPTSKATFGDYFPTWIKGYAGRTARGFSETTRPEYERPIRAYAMPAWETWRLADVEPNDVRALFTKMREDNESTAQIKKLRAALSPLFATAVEDGLLRSNPVAGVRIPAGRDSGDAPEEKAKALTRAELRLLLAAVPEDWRLFFEFLAVSGLRIGEAIGLRWEHLTLAGESSRVEVREQVYRGQRKRLKSGNGRRDVPLSPAMAKRLLAHRRDNYKGPKAPVFASKAGTELHPSNVQGRILAPAAIGLGFKVEVIVKGEDGEDKVRERSTVSFHTFRHTCASLLFDAGRNVKQVQEWLGHADPGFTLRTYVHLLDAGVGEGLEFDSRVNTGSTRGLQKGINAGSPETPKTA